MSPAVTGQDTRDTAEFDPVVHYSSGDAYVSGSPMNPHNRPTELKAVRSDTPDDPIATRQPSEAKYESPPKKARRSKSSLHRARDKPHNPDEIPERPYSRPWMQLAWSSFQMTMSPLTVVAWMLLCALVGIILGVTIITESDNMYEQTVMYGNVRSYTYPITPEAQNFSRDNGGVGFEAEGGIHYQGARTAVEFDVGERVDPPIYLSYVVRKMIMSYRQYENSRSELQVYGEDINTKDLINCRPLRAPGELSHEKEVVLRTSFRVDGDAERLYGDMRYFPCGAIPWSMFNDSLMLYRINDTSQSLVCNASDFSPSGDRLTMNFDQNPCTKREIAWRSDRVRRFKPKQSQFDNLEYWSGRGGRNSSDPYLANGWYYKEAGHKIPDVTDEDLMVWMRISSLGHFRKMHRVIHVPLLPGRYRLEVDEFFDVASFGGDKGILLRSKSWVGSKNYPLGGALLGGGSACTFFAIAFFIRGNLQNLKGATTKGPESESEDDAMTA